MIPILFFGEATAFDSNGIGRLTDCVSCTVTEERNGIYECEFEYPISGIRYSEIKEGRIIACTHDDKQDLQPFRIYRRSAPIDGIVTFNAHHVSYDLANVILKPFTAASIGAAFIGFTTQCMNENKFSFWTDKASVANFKISYPISIKAVLGGMEGSILDVYGGGEYEWDKYTVKLYQHRGSDSGVTIRYGKNMTDIEHEIDVGETYTAVVPYWQDQSTGNVIYGDPVYGPGTSLLVDTQKWNDENMALMKDENGNVYEFSYSKPILVPLDLSSAFGDGVVPTKSQLNAKAQQKLNSGTQYVPKENIKVDFVQLWQTSEYEDVAALQRVGLCDTVSVYFPALGVKAVNQKIIKVVYNVLLNRYDSMELGEAKTSFAKVITGEFDEALSDVVTSDTMRSAIEHATDLITGGAGGHVVFQLDADGKPQEIFVMDTEDVNTAINVLRINVNGIGFSSNGIDGPYRSAWTLDGHFVADFIDTGNLNASLITAGTMAADHVLGGTLTLGYKDNKVGTLVIKDTANRVIGEWGIDGISISSGSIQLPFAGGAGTLTVNSVTGYELEYKNSRQEAIVCGYHGIDNYPASGTEFGMQQYSYRNSSDTEWTYNIIPCGVRLAKTQWSGGSGTYQITGYFDVSGFGIWDGVNHRGCSYLLNSDSFSCSGTKSRRVKTEDYASRLLYAYETPTPMFGDLGEGVIGEDGTAYIMIESIFAQTISSMQYQVFLQKYGEGECYVADRKAAYFVVKGTPGLAFGWEIKGKQAGFDQIRMETVEDELNTSGTDYGELAASYISDLKEGRTA